MPVLITLDVLRGKLFGKIQNSDMEKYELKQVVGRGAFAWCHLAIRKQDGKNYLIKVLYFIN